MAVLCGRNANTLDRYARERLAFLAATSSFDGCLADFSEDLVPGNELPERCVFTVKKGRITQTNEELATGRIRIIRASHGNNAALMRAFVKLSFDLVAWVTGTPLVFSPQIFGQRIAALNHEAFDDPMKSRAIVKALVRKLLKILHSFGSDIRPQFQRQLAGTRFDNCRVFHRRVV